ncbi:MAG TPA: DinB family protein [Pyrinomonadaceae bacterium]|nr:DinB family protein [Pyrinomonadaceae bacterium]
METVKRTLEARAGFSREIGFYLSGWEKTRAELREIVSDLSREELSRRILPGAHQIGGLILHLGESEAGWIHERITGKELSDEERRFVHWCDTTETDFAEKGCTAQDCLERIDKISEMSREILREFTDGDLERLFAYERDGGERVEVSLRWVLHHLIDHEANHKGQISMMKRFLREAVQN